MVIADVGAPGDQSAARDVLDSTGPPAHDKVTKTLLHELEVDKPDFTVTFTEDKNGFYINGRKFSMQDQPLVRVRVGGIEHWRIVNATREVHPFHIHQIHFLAFAENGIRSDSPEWLDTVNVPYGGNSRPHHGLY
jgi:FtsP/CotA-like multicopper oxidase with cupredoxin domain